MPVVCPCCRASNEVGPACRRCRADLSLLFQLEAERNQLLNQSRQLLLAGDYTQAVSILNRVEMLRSDRDSRQLRSLASLLQRDFAGALTGYLAATAPSAGRV